MPENPALMNSASTQPRSDYTTPSSPSRSGGWRRYLSSVLIIVGTLILSYVASQYYGMYREQKELGQEWAKQQNVQPHKPGNAPVRVEGLIRVSIPKINLEAIVLDGTGRKQLKNGPGRVIGTALPGEPGNSVITAHRDTFFRHIYELNKGDSIMVQRNGETLRFEVTGKKVVEPDDLSVLKQSDDSRLTLITCYPIYYIGPAPQRLVVFSKLAEDKKAVASSQ